MVNEWTRDEWKARAEAAERERDEWQTRAVLGQEADQ